MILDSYVFENFDRRYDLPTVFNKMSDLIEKSKFKYPDNKISLVVSATLIDKMIPSYDGQLEYNLLGEECRIDKDVSELKFLIIDKE